MEENVGESIDEWIAQKEEQSPTFKFWVMLLRLITLLLSFVRSLRVGNYKLFITSLKRMTPWFFAFDHTHYARWLTVHLKDLEELSEKAPTVYAEFCHGNFVVRKTHRKFSALAVDQAHEQNNAIIKDDGGAIGLTEDPAALRRWSVAGPEVCRLVNEFSDDSADGKIFCHHEETRSSQKKFNKDCHALRESFLEYGNPFLEVTSSLVTLGSRVVIPDEGIKTLNSVENDGIKLFETFVTERFINKSKTVFDPIPKGKRTIFSFKNSTGKVSSREKRTDEQLFSKLFIAAQSRKLDLDKFFSYENQSYPPSLSNGGELRIAKAKHELTSTLLETIKMTTIPVHCDGIIYDGPVLIHRMKPQSSKTFAEYCECEILPTILQTALRVHARRVDLVWDIYNEDSLKNTTRSHRGCGVRRQVSLNSKLPKNWPEFLRNSSNKEELFAILSRYILAHSNLPVVTNIGSVIHASSNNTQETFLHNMPCHDVKEEADGRIILHANDMVLHGAKNILIYSTDTDVVVLAVSFFHALRSKGLQNLWILYGAGKNQKYIPIHQISEQLGEKKSVALRGFHAFTGCDMVSAFSSKGKRSAWKTWNTYNEATVAFAAISHPREVITTTVLRMLELFTIRLYGGNPELKSVDKVRRDLFATKSKPMKNLPPTADALKQHTLRASYQAGYIWGQADICSSSEPAKHFSPANWGWHSVDNQWTPKWTIQPQIWEMCREIVKCSCKQLCTSKKCSCVAAGVFCTYMCSHCRSNCKNSTNRYVLITPSIICN